MKKVAGLLILAGFALSVFATDSRVITMGRHDAFFMDETSIFRNPANLNYYPNLLYGSAGIYVRDSSLDDTAQFNLNRWNRDPQKPYFGAILSYSLNPNAVEAGNQYPMISLGVGLNRYDPMLKYITNNNPLEKYKSPVGKIDLMVGYALSNGGMLGVGTYLAFQKNSNQNGDIEYASNLFKGNIGLNWPLAKTIDIEASVGVAGMTGIGNDTTGLGAYEASNTPIDAALRDTMANGHISIAGDIRLFSALPAINGDVVPHLGINRTTFLRKNTLGVNQEVTLIDVALGLGVNVNIDKGFFWAGIEGLYKDSTFGTNTAINGIGGRVSFGIERNVIWDWFVLRAGGMKTIMIMTDNQRGWWEENMDADASDGDLIGVGVGLNIENRLKIDGVIAEDVFYTFTNLISSPMHHLQNRICLTYSF